MGTSLEGRGALFSPPQLPITKLKFCHLRDIPSSLKFHMFKNPFKNAHTPGKGAAKSIGERPGLLLRSLCP